MEIYCGIAAAVFELSDILVGRLMNGDMASY